MKCVKLGKYRPEEIRDPHGSVISFYNKVKNSSHFKVCSFQKVACILVNGQSVSLIKHIHVFIRLLGTSGSFKNTKLFF